MATVYLAPAPTGDDTRTYAQAQNIGTPWATPGKVQTSAVSGDTVQMAAGTYTFANIIFTAQNFTWVGAALSNGAPTTIVDGANAAVGWHFNNGTITSISNIKFSNVIGTAATYGVAFYLQYQAQLSFTNCQFLNIKNSNAGETYALIFGEVMQTGGSLTFTSCLFINCYNSVSAVHGCMIRIHFDSGTPVLTLNNCTIAWTNQGAIASQLFYVDANVTFTQKNCIVANMTANAYNYIAGGISPATTYTDNFSWTGAPAGTGNITSDPLFVDAANANFNLRPTSPCLGTGIIV